MLSNQENRSINEIMGIVSVGAPSTQSSLIDTVERLCNVPISTFDTEDYRVLINQGIALEYIVPTAVDILSKNLFVEGDYFEGDLLKSVLTIDESFWNTNPLLKNKLMQACSRDFQLIESLDLSTAIKENLSSLVKAFIASE